MKRRPSTITDIAKALNVSASTVSRALHDSPSISQETKDAVIALAKQLNYQPNMLAVSLLNKKTKTIGVIVPEITSYFFATVISGVQDMVEEANYKLIICQSNESFEEEKKLIETLSLGRVDGFLISPSSKTTNFEHLEKLRASGNPVVVFDRDCPNFEADKVLVDDYDGAFQAVDYLVKTGCQRIAHITGPKNLTTCQHRKAGYLDALKKNGRTVNPDYITEVEGFTSEDGEEAAKKLLDLDTPPDAIFAINDAVAIGAMAVIREKGIHIPEEISLVGFDDEPYSKYFKPSLTSVWQPVYDLGMLSSRILMNHILNDLEDYNYRYELLKPELIIRNSSRPLP
ncbi:LacI family DNA-binding transcriptional regulator [Echinicola jeungdonensis]|uniref:LacI family DNA-binding transcriptional regulator n=1 Tax=Echinicola jeungdonensis TaxID=709343 RepID=A0ABV5J9N4_9BACT|nr:LacI family DNA-binding transcriptional regulator [Echinicola jeungdonensis]MDN3670364.1 LacI family DNA-binding transcriptional regulator [Echinicola jeungdonensis]